MGETGDRMERAGRYVLGLMNDEERERAERDMETDAALRHAMVEVAERMHIFDRILAPDKFPSDDWLLIKERIAAMPQMRPAPQPEPSPQVTFGRRRSDKVRAPTVPEAGTVGTGLHAVPGRRALLLALCLIAAFALGYMAGVAAPPA